MNVKKMVVYYSFVFYCMVMFSFIACIILLCKAFGGVIFEVQTYINSKREVEVSPRGTRIFSKWFAGILGIFFIYILAGYYMPVILYTPRILSGVSIGIQGEVLSNHQEEIAFIWIAVACFLFVLTGRRLLLALTQRVQIKRKRTEIYLWGREYWILLLVQALATSVCLFVLVCSLTGGYTEAVEKIWKISAWAEYILALINGMYTHQKLFIFDNGVVTYHKYQKEGFGEKEDLEIVEDDSDRILIRFKGENKFELECGTPRAKEELIHVQKMLAEKKAEKTIEETRTDEEVSTEKRNTAVDSAGKVEQKIELHSLENDSKVQLAKEWFMVCKTKNNMQMLYLWKGTENRHITTAKWSIEHKDGELNIKGKITFAQIFLILFIIVEIIFAAGFTFFGIAAILDNDMVFGEKVLFVCFMLVLDPMCIFLCYVINKIFNVEPVKYLYKYLNNIQKK